MGFDAGAGTNAADSSGQENNGAISGATWVEDGRYGGALRFDGVDDWVTVPDDDSLDLTDELTLTAWIKPTAANPFMSVLMKEASTSYEYALYASDGDGDQASGWVGASGAYSATATPLNEWHHFAVTFSGSTVRLYMDGVLKNTQTGATTPLGSNGVFRIGGTAVYANEFFKGLIDEVRVYNEALTVAELQDEAATPVTPPRGGDPVLSLSFDEGTGPIARDGSVFHNDGTITGATWTNDGRFGKALSFDGSDDQVVVPDASSLDLTGDVTVSAWVKPASLRSYMTVLLKERPTASDYAYALYATNGGTQYRPNAWIEAAGVYAPDPIVTGTWQHLAMVYDSRTLRIYVGGQLVDTRTNVDPPTDSAGALRIGGNTIWNNEFFHGLIDEVRVYNRAVPQRDLVISDTPGNNPGTGDTGFFTYRPATPALGAKVNVASGNLLVHAADLPDSSGNSHVVVDRYYNSLSPNSSAILSPRWSFDIGPETTLATESNGDVTAVGPTGYRIRFVKQPDNSYVPPTGFDGVLVKTSSGWTLTRTSKSDQFLFGNAGGLDSTLDAASRPFTIANTSSGGSTVLSSYGTPTGQRANFSYNGDGRIRRLDSPSSTAHDYRYTSGNLTEREDPGPALTTYEYDAEGLLRKITAPNGDTVDLDVSSRGRVHSFKSTPAGGPAQTTRFAYTRRPFKTDVTGPDAARRTYAYDADWRVTRQYDPDVVPTVSASGPMYDLRDKFTQGNSSLTAQVSATQPDGAGLTRLAVEHVGGARLGYLDPTCTDTQWDHVCPTSFSGTVSADLTQLPEGRAEIRATARDDEGNLGRTSPWTIFVDRSAPSVPAGFATLYDHEDGFATFSWTSSDPLLSDGSVGVGVQQYSYRYRINAGSWTAWAVTEDDSFDVPAVSPTDQITGEVTATDAVGNTSTVGSDTILADSYVPNPGDDNGVSGDTAPDAGDEDDLGIEPCEAAYGSNSEYCESPEGFAADSVGSGSNRALGRSTSISTLIYGIADEDSAWARTGQAGGVDNSYLDNLAFRSLEVKRIRRIVPWDIAQKIPGTSNWKYPDRIARFAAHYTRAIDWNKDLMVSFQFGCGGAGSWPQVGDGPTSCTRGTQSGLEVPPSQQEYIRAVRAFKERFPRVVWMSAWNEPNHETQPLQVDNGTNGGGPKRAALYTYSLERYVCAPFRRAGSGDCETIAGDLAQDKAFGHIKYFETYYENLLDRFDATPSGITDLKRFSHFALHAYSDVANMRSVGSSGTFKMLKRLKDSERLWFTEVGARVDAYGSTPKKTDARQVAEIGYLTDVLATASPRIDRLYYYNFCPLGLGDRADFDSSLWSIPAQQTGGASCTTNATERPSLAAYRDRTEENPYG